LRYTREALRLPDMRGSAGCRSVNICRGACCAWPWRVLTQMILESLASRPKLAWKLLLCVVARVCRALLAKIRCPVGCCFGQAKIESDFQIVEPFS